MHILQFVEAAPMLLIPQSPRMCELPLGGRSPDSLFSLPHKEAEEPTIDFGADHSGSPRLAPIGALVDWNPRLLTKRQSPPFLHN